MKHDLLVAFASKVMTSFGFTRQLYKNSEMYNLNFYGANVIGILN